MKIDEFDLQLLAILKHNGRASVTALADELHSSRHKVAYRMRRLEKLGVIHSYTCYVDFETATKGFYALIRLKVRPNKIDSVQTKIMAIKESYGIYHLTGEFNLEVLGLFENKNHQCHQDVQDGKSGCAGPAWRQHGSPTWRDGCHRRPVGQWQVHTVGFDGRARYAHRREGKD